MAQIRLNKFLAQCGVGSRRRCDDYIAQGLVKINEQVTTKLGTTLDPAQDRVLFKDKPVEPQQEIFILLNKPKGYLVTAKDTHDRRTVFDLLSEIDVRLFPVGRLDMDTHGLLLLTNSGKLAHRLTHPKFHVRKTYQALVEGQPDEAAIEKLQTGVVLEDGLTAPARARILSRRRQNTLLEIKIHEGRKRQVRRMCDAIGHPVLDLKRVAIDRLRLQNLAPGQWRHLTPGEVAAFKRRVNLTESD